MTELTTRYPKLYRALYDHYQQLYTLYTTGMQLTMSMKKAGALLDFDIATHPDTLAKQLAPFAPATTDQNALATYADNLVQFMRKTVWCNLPHTRGNMTHTSIIPLRIITNRLQEVIHMLHCINQNQLNTPIFRRLDTPDVAISVFNQWLDSNALREAYYADLDEQEAQTCHILY